MSFYKSKEFCGEQTDMPDKLKAFEKPIYVTRPILPSINEMIKKIV